MGPPEGRVPGHAVESIHSRFTRGPSSCGAPQRDDDVPVLNDETEGDAMTPVPAGTHARRAAVALATTAVLTLAPMPAIAAPDVAPSYAFDFGTATSPVADGYSKVTEAATYSVEAGYGIAAGVTPISRHRATDGSVVAAASWQFLVDLPNGLYDVTGYSGDQLAGTSRTRTDVTLEGAVAGQLSSLREVTSATWRTTVADGQLTVGLGGNGYLNGLVVTAVAATPDPEPITE